jgi:hypothetical protein
LPPFLRHFSISLKSALYFVRLCGFCRRGNFTFLLRLLTRVFGREINPILSFGNCLRGSGFDASADDDYRLARFGGFRRSASSQRKNSFGKRSKRLPGIVLGLAASSFYWLRMVREMSWVNHAAEKIQHRTLFFRHRFFLCISTRWRPITQMMS